MMMVLSRSRRWMIPKSKRVDKRRIGETWFSISSMIEASSDSLLLLEEKNETSWKMDCFKMISFKTKKKNRGKEVMRKTSIKLGFLMGNFRVCLKMPNNPSFSFVKTCLLSIFLKWSDSDGAYLISYKGGDHDSWTI